MKKVRALIDISYIMRSNFDSYKKLDTPEEEYRPFSLWRHMVIEKILDYKVNSKADEVIICCDHGSWRKDYFPEYKANRSYKDMEDYFEQSNELLNEIKNFFPWKVLQVYKSEGDDICASLIINKEPGKFIDIIYSCDKDLKQLLFYPDVIYFDAKKGKTVLIDDPEKFKEENLTLLLRGDSSDNIPNVLTDSKVKGKRSKSVTKEFINECKTNLNKILDMDSGIKRRFERNKKLILLTKNNIPQDIQNKILNDYNNYEFGTGSLKDYFNEWKMFQLLDRVEEF